MPSQSLPDGVETWMVDYEHGDGEPQHAILSWVNDEAQALPEAGTQLIRLSDRRKIEEQVRQQVREVFAPEIEALRREVGEEIDLAASYREEGRTTKAEIAENKAREASNRLAALDHKGDADA